MSANFIPPRQFSFVREKTSTVGNANRRRKKHFLSTISRRQSTEKTKKRRSSFFFFFFWHFTFQVDSSLSSSHRQMNQSTQKKPKKKTKQNPTRDEAKLRSPTHPPSNHCWASYRYQNENIFISRKKRPPRLMVVKDVCPAVVAQSPQVANAKMRKRRQLRRMMKSFPDI